MDQLAQLANSIVEASPTPTIAATNTTAQLTDQVSELTRQLEDLSTQMSKAISSFRCPRSQSPGPRRRRQSRSHTPAADDNLCWYH